jgi:hypothetical protein
MRIRVLAMKHLTSKLLLLSLLVLDSARAEQAGRTPGAGARPAVQEAPPSSGPEQSGGRGGDAEVPEGEGLGLTRLPCPNRTKQF